MKDEDIFNDSTKAMVLAIAKSYKIPNGCSVTFEDLVQAGYEGLWRAALRYEDTGEAKFTTYARYWVKGAILKEIFRTGPILSGRDAEGNFEKPLYLEDIDAEQELKSLDILDALAVENVFEFISDDLTDLERLCIAMRLGIGTEKMSLRAIERKLFISRYFVTKSIDQGMKKLQEKGIA